MQAAVFLGPANAAIHAATFNERVSTVRANIETRPRVPQETGFIAVDTSGAMALVQSIRDAGRILTEEAGSAMMAVAAAPHAITATGSHVASVAAALTAPSVPLADPASAGAPLAELSSIVSAKSGEYA